MFHPTRSVGVRTYCYDYCGNEKSKCKTKSKTTKRKMLQKEYATIVERKSKHVSEINTFVNDKFHEINMENIVDIVYISLIIMNPFSED